MAARNAVVGLIEVADGRSRSALLYGYNSGLERVNTYTVHVSESIGRSLALAIMFMAHRLGATSARRLGVKEE